MLYKIESQSRTPDFATAAKAMNSAISIGRALTRLCGREVVVREIFKQHIWLYWNVLHPKTYTGARELSLRVAIQGAS